MTAPTAVGADVGAGVAAGAPPAHPGGLADLLTLSRLPLAVLLPVTAERPGLFLAVLAVCALTDVLDGPLARRQGTAGATGAMLDSIADVMLAVGLVASAMLLAPELARWVPWLGVLVGLRLVVLGLGWHRHGRPVLVHTLLSKVTGTVLVVGAAVLVVTGGTALLVLTLPLALVAAVEEGVLHLTGRGAGADHPGLVGRWRPAR